MNKDLKQFYSDHSARQSHQLSEEASNRVKDNIFSKLETAPLEVVETISLWGNMGGLLVRGYILAPLLVLLFVVGTSYASADAMPGDLLYPVKLEIENARIFVTPSEDAKSALRINFVQERLNEFEKIRDNSDAVNADHKRADDSTSVNKEADDRSGLQDKARAETSRALESLQKNQQRWESRGETDKAEKMQEKVDQFKTRFENRGRNGGNINLNNHIEQSR